MNISKFLDYADKMKWYIEFYPGCNDPGYDDKPVCLANWNDIPDKVFNALEHNDISCEWEDEWTSCGDCGKVVRTSPDSYGWQSSYAILNECDLLCIECLKNSIEEYYQELENKDRNAVTIPIADKYNPSEYGYTLVNEGYENGFHPGQNDNPKEILKQLLEHNPKGKFLFVMTGQGQFDIEFAVYQKIEDLEDEED